MRRNELNPMRWRDFEYGGVTFDLTHLHPRTFRFERPTEGDKPPEVFKVDTIFASHCFTRGPRESEAFDLALVYPDGNEDRIFDHRRYELSKRLPEFIQALPTRKPRHNGKRGNFFSVEVIAEDGTAIEYDIFFKVKKKAKGRLELIVETAFVRDSDYGSTRPDGKPIRFWIILHNTLNNIRIHS